jgi:predicted  nucleic acid-binding Zn-ribbon protein
MGGGEVNNNPDEAYNALFRSYEGANRRIKELEAQLTEVGKRIESAQSDSRKAIQILFNIEAQLTAAQADIAKWKQPLADECESSLEDIIRKATGE